MTREKISRDFKMVKKCLYCGEELQDSCVVDFCHVCGVNVFGKKMFDTIISNMEEARDNNDLCHNRSSDFVREAEPAKVVEPAERLEFGGEFSL